MAEQLIVFGVAMVHYKPPIHHGLWRAYVNKTIKYLQYQYNSVDRFSFTQPIYIAYQLIGDEIKSKRAMILMSKKTLHTKFGNARIINNRYFVITSSKEGNNNKYLHKLIFEEFYGYTVPEQFVVHHKDGNKLNNCILNLQLMRKKEHLSLHHNGTSHSEKTRLKISEARKGKCAGENNYYYKNHYRVVKLGSPGRTQRYAIIKNKKIIKSSTNPLYLSKWFKENHPNEEFENKYEHLGWEVINRYKLRPKGNINGKKRYCIRYCGKVLKQSISKEKLIKWFEKEYPSEILEMCEE